MIQTGGGLVGNARTIHHSIQLYIPDVCVRREKRATPVRRHPPPCVGGEPTHIIYAFSPPARPAKESDALLEKDKKRPFLHGYLPNWVIAAAACEIMAITEYSTGKSARPYFCLFRYSHFMFGLSLFPSEARDSSSCPLLFATTFHHLSLPLIPPPHIRPSFIH